MASSRKLKSNKLSRSVENILGQHVQPGDRLALALSGGIDSVVLLDLLVPLSSRIPFSLSAIHVDHGISTNSAEWAEFCGDLCRSAGIPLNISKVQVLKEPGESLEAAARERRYLEFSKLDADYVVLAQHLDDQAETLLLQLLRGAGIKGLRAMPVVRDFSSAITGSTPTGELPSSWERRGGGHLRVLRPILEISRREIEDYAEERGLRWVSDESNIDVSFDRNFLRHQVFPLLEKRFPAYQQTLARASRHIAEAAALLDELAESDGKGCAASGRLEIAQLQKLSLARAKNLLRYTLARQGAILPSAAKLDDMLRQILSSSSDSKIHVIFGDTEIRCFRGQLYVGRASIVKAGNAGMRESDVSGWRLEWRGEEQLEVRKLGGMLHFSSCQGAGISLKKLIEAPVTVRPRLGGECLSPAYNRPRRTLKNLLREAGLPPWERQTLPLIFSGERLVCVPGVAVDCGYQAAGEEGLVVTWNRDKG